jgi:hypothetical protein
LLENTKKKMAKFEKKLPYRRREITGMLEIYLNKLRCAQRICRGELRKIYKKYGTNLLENDELYGYDIEGVPNSHIIQESKFELICNDGLRLNRIEVEFPIYNYEDTEIVKLTLFAKWIGYNKEQMRKEVKSRVQWTILNTLRSLKERVDFVSKTSEKRIKAISRFEEDLKLQKKD